jgi:K+-sensing histidine kinase KdpD
VPIPVEGEPRYCLFVFSLKPGHFELKERYVLVKYAAAKIARALQTLQTGVLLKDYARMRMRWAIMGHLLHEMKHCVFSVDLDMHLLQLRKEKDHNGRIPEPEIFRHISSNLSDLRDLINLAQSAFRDTTEPESMQVSEILRVTGPLLDSVMRYLHNNAINVEVQSNGDASIKATPLFFTELLSAILLYGGRNADRGSRIVIRYERRDEHHAFVLCFYGLRIDESEKDNFWESFESEVTGEAGLELCYARVLTQQMGGDIQVTSAMPLEFTILLPIESKEQTEN